MNLISKLYSSCVISDLYWFWIHKTTRSYSFCMLSRSYIQLTVSHGPSMWYANILYIVLILLICSDKNHYTANSLTHSICSAFLWYTLPGYITFVVHIYTRIYHFSFNVKPSIICSTYTYKLYFTFSNKSTARYCILFNITHPLNLKINEGIYNAESFLNAFIYI